MKTNSNFIIIVISTVCLATLSTVLWWYFNAPKYNLIHKPDTEMIELIERTVEIDISPKMPYSFSKMKIGAIQHLDRNYTYDIIPAELIGGLLFQGVHRPPKGTTIEFKLLMPAKVYFFFHAEFDGGYTQQFHKLPHWQRCTTFPKYDIDNGDHGLKMTMYSLNADAGVYQIPPTLLDNACFNIVFVTDSQN